ncbi:MAG: long-chain-acyl-CoA synthetase [Hyphomicrobiales bacterium]|nr:long-chain-acyl-CoA synthetase [Hyphomicrobiales bacterium]
MNPPTPNGAAVTTPARAWLRALETTAQATRDPERVLPRAVAEWARKYGDATAFVSDRECFSFRALEARMNQYSRWALSVGVTSGESIALVMGNRPEYFAIWLGLTQVGAIVALISPDLRAPALAHALKVAEARRAIAASECAEVCSAAIARLDEEIEIWTHGGGPSDARQVDLAVSARSGEPLSQDERRHVTLADRALRIFTSGTTGLPKAAEVSHHRLVGWTHWFAGLAGLSPTDRLYNCLPMHHSVGGVVAIGAPLVFGGSVAISERFSARGFWDDVMRWECTAFQYIGELCRYLIAAPVRPEERAHKLRIAIGNGLSQEVWRAVLDRIGPVRILEFYASTEGNVWLYNVESKVGSIGRTPPYLAVRDSIALVRFDDEIQMPIRGPDGFCLRCADAEIGEALGRIGEDPGARFEGYSEGAETEKKILRDVFKAGDAWMRTGDLMRRDADGFYTFVNRIGDTFRWKGENVSTSEVSAALQACPGVTQAIVYGVAVPGAEGRAGMALLKIDDRFDLGALARRLEILPGYARPQFLRVAVEIEATETFKPKRRLYVEQGFDPTRVEDPLYVFDRERQTYLQLDAERYAAIRNGALRL